MSRLLFLLWILCGPVLNSLAQRQATVAISLLEPARSAQNLVAVTISVTDQDGPVTRGQVDLLDGGKLVGTAQLVSSGTAGFLPGTAIMRRLFRSGAHSLRSSFRGTTTDSAALSEPISLQIEAAQSWPSETPFYTQTQDLTYHTELNKLASISPSRMLTMTASPTWSRQSKSLGASQSRSEILRIRDSSLRRPSSPRLLSGRTQG